MKIGILPWTFDSQKTGLDNYLRNLITGMIELGKSKEIYRIHFEKNDDELSGATNEIILPNLPKIINIPLYLPYAINKSDLDVIHASAPFPSQLAQIYLKIGLIP
jgi:hypothetical protein